MRWPPWKPDPDEVRARREAERRLAELRARRSHVEAVADAIDHDMLRNGFLQKALAMRERGNQ